jgi:hypothetical protein
LKKRLSYLFNFYSKEKMGVQPFVYGRDFKSDMPDEEIEYINKATLVLIEERKKKINGVVNNLIQEKNDILSKLIQHKQKKMKEKAEREKLKS